MALLTVQQLEDFLETDRSDDSLQLLLDAAEADIVSAFGPHATQTDTHIGGDPMLFLSRPAQSITTVVEKISNVDTTLAANDYELSVGGRVLRRVTTGTHGRATWGERITVTFVPSEDLARRKRIQVDLVKLSLKYDGVKSSTEGDFSSNTFGMNYEEERQSILRTLANKQRVLS